MTILLKLNLRPNILNLKFTEKPAFQNTSKRENPETVPLDWLCLSDMVSTLKT